MNKAGLVPRRCNAPSLQVSAFVRSWLLLLFRAKVVLLAKNLYQFVLSLQGSQPRKVEKSYHRPASRNTAVSCEKSVCAFGAHTHTLFSGDSGVLRLSGLWYDFWTFLGVPAVTNKLVRPFRQWYDFSTEQ